MRLVNQVNIDYNNSLNECNNDYICLNIFIQIIGGHMYTGGGECVLVKWVLANPHHKSFLPRLPAPIKHLTIAPDNLYVAVSTLDNGTWIVYLFLEWTFNFFKAFYTNSTWYLIKFTGIVVVNPQRKLTSVIQNFTWGVALSSQDLFPAGLIVDPRTGSLVLNSRTGHVQFYNTYTKSLLYNVSTILLYSILYYKIQI